MTRRRTQKLTVRKKALRRLDVPKLEQVRGGLIVDDATGGGYTDTCDTCGCGEMSIASDTDGDIYGSNPTAAVTFLGTGRANHNQPVRR